MAIDSKTGLNTEGPANILPIAGQMDYFHNLFPHGPTNTLETLKGVEDIRASQARTKLAGAEISLRERSLALQEQLAPLEVEKVRSQIKAQGVLNNMHELSIRQTQLGLDRASAAQGQLLQQIKDTPAAEAELSRVLDLKDPAEIQAGLNNFHRKYPWGQFDQGMQQTIKAAQAKPAAADFLKQQDQDIIDAKNYGLPMSTIIGGPNHDQLVDVRKQLAEGRMRSVWQQAAGGEQRRGTGPYASDFDEQWAQWTKNPNAFDQNGDLNPGLGIVMANQMNEWQAKIGAKTGRNVGGLWKFEVGKGLMVESPQLSRNSGSGGAGNTAQVGALKTMMNDATRGYNQARTAYNKAKADDDQQGMTDAQEEMQMYQDQHNDAREQLGTSGVTQPFTPPAPAAPNTDSYFGNAPSTPPKAPPPPAPQKPIEVSDDGVPLTWPPSPEHALLNQGHPLVPTEAPTSDQIGPGTPHETDLAYSDNFDDLFNV